MRTVRRLFVASLLATLAACSRSPPGELTYSHRPFLKRAEQHVPAAIVYVYTLGGVHEAATDEHLNLIRQSAGASGVPEVLPLVRNALEAAGYATSVVNGRTDALCAKRAIPDGVERIVTLIAARGERTVQLQHVARNRAGNGVDTNCGDAATVAHLLDLTLASVH
jgi:hypothetical protein